ncbi:hypothetical protein Q5752_003605 [Cryptotrichosporon argae]
MSEKQPATVSKAAFASPLPMPASQPAAKRRSRLYFATLLAAVYLLAMPYLSPSPAGHHGHARCPSQPAPLNVGTDWDPVADTIYGELAARRLSKAVQINTVSYDDMPADPSDARFAGHAEFAHFMETEYPKVYGALSHEAVNTHAHLFTWAGRNAALAPVLLMAHIDTVPVNSATVGQWVYPPFSGEIAVNGTPDTPGTWVWGRGASDTKNSVVGILGAVERLVTEGFEPERTILIAYGFDEEIGGPRGAGHIAPLLEERYGADGVAFLVDEGFSGIENTYGARVASLGMAEKGAVNFQLTVETPGGHSSVPPEHTGIGYTSLLLSAIEAHPFEPSLSPSSPYLSYLTCLAEHAPAFPKTVRRQLADPRQWPKLARQLAAKDRRVNSMLATTVAIDLISGGVKVNALPEVVEATINHRIAFTSSVNETAAHMVKVLEPVAHKHGFSFAALGAPATSAHACHGSSAAAAGKGKGNDTDTATRRVRFELANKMPLEPAPITAADTAPWALIGGTIRTVFGAHTVVSPTGMYANTDTAHMWNVTKHIYRFTPAFVQDAPNQHTVSERISLDAHLSTTRFYYKLLRNTQGWAA